MYMQPTANKSIFVTDKDMVMVEDYNNEISSNNPFSDIYENSQLQHTLVNNYHC